MIGPASGSSAAIAIAPTPGKRSVTGRSGWERVAFPGKRATRSCCLLNWGHEPHFDSTEQAFDTQHGHDKNWLELWSAQSVHPQPQWLAPHPHANVTL